MPQNDRNRKRRRAYDQARDDRRGGQSTQRRSSAGAGSDLGYSGYAGYSSGGHPITNPNYDPDAPRPSRYTERTVNYGSYPDNSITFPTGGRSSQSGAQRPRSGQNGQRRTSGGNQRNRRPASGQNRNAQRRPQNAQSRNGQRMRPVQGQNARRDLPSGGRAESGSWTWPPSGGAGSCGGSRPLSCCSASSARGSTSP